MSDLTSKTKVLECIGNAINEIVNLPTTHDNARETHDLISRKAATHALCKGCDLVNDDTCGEKCIDTSKTLEKLPFAEPERHGRWIYNPYGHYTCDQCGEIVAFETNYCPNCGARMDGESESLKFWNLGKSIADGIEAGIKGESE